MKSLVLILRTADNYTQTENMDNIHPESNESAKQPDESLSDLEQYFDNVTVDEAAHKAPEGISILYERMISNLECKTLSLKEHFSPRISTSME